MLQPLHECSATILPELILRAKDSTLQMTGAMLGDTQQYRKIISATWDADAEILTLRVANQTTPICFDGGAWSMMVDQKRLGVTSDLKLARMTNTYDIVLYDPNCQTALIVLPIATK